MLLPLDLRAQNVKRHLHRCHCYHMARFRGNIGSRLPCKRVLRSARQPLDNRTKVRETLISPRTPPSVSCFGTFRVNALLERKREARSDEWDNCLPHVGDNGRSRSVGELCVRLSAWDPRRRREVGCPWGRVRDRGSRPHPALRRRAGYPRRVVSPTIKPTHRYRVLGSVARAAAADARPRVAGGLSTRASFWCG